MNRDHRSVPFVTRNRVWNLTAGIERAANSGQELRRRPSHERNVLTNERAVRLMRLSSVVQPKGRFVSRKFLVTVVGALAIVALAATPAAAAPETGSQLSSVIDGLRIWIVGLLAGLATLFLTIGGVRYMLAGGDPMQVERAKSALRSAAVGYALAALSPVLVDILRSVVGS